MALQKFQKINQLMIDFRLEFVGPEMAECLKCTYCKLVLRDACQVPCGCKLCLSCIKLLMDNGIQFCPGTGDDCGESILTKFVKDFQTIKVLSSMLVTCPFKNCPHQCELTDLIDHMDACGRKKVKCPYFAFGCTQNDIVFEEMDAHFHSSVRRHGEILLEMINNFNNEMTQNGRELHDLRQRLKREPDRFEFLDDSLASGDDYNRERLLHVLRPRSNEEILGNNKSPGEARFQQSLRQLKDMFYRELAQVREENQVALQALEARMSAMAIARTDHFNGDFLWSIMEIKLDDQWDCNDFAESDFYHGTLYEYRFRFSLLKSSSDTLLYLRVLIYVGEKDNDLIWPFRGTITIGITDQTDLHPHKSITQHCNINRPTGNSSNCSDAFIFDYSGWARSGMQLSRGLSLKCTMYVD